MILHSPDIDRFLIVYHVLGQGLPVLLIRIKTWVRVSDFDLDGNFVCVHGYYGVGLVFTVTQLLEVLLSFSLAHFISTGMRHI